MPRVYETKLTSMQFAQAATMLANGKTQKQVAAHFDIHPNTLSRYLQRVRDGGYIGQGQQKPKKYVCGTDEAAHNYCKQRRGGRPCEPCRLAYNKIHRDRYHKGKKNGRHKKNKLVPLEELDAKIPECGTTEKYQYHVRWGEEVDEKCREAIRAHRRREDEIRRNRIRRDPERHEEQKRRLRILATARRARKDRDDGKELTEWQKECLVIAFEEYGSHPPEWTGVDLEREKKKAQSRADYKKSQRRKKANIRRNKQVDARKEAA